MDERKERMVTVSVTLTRDDYLAICAHYAKDKLGRPMVPVYGIHHNSDKDCRSTIVDDECLVCGVFHGDPCFECGGRGYHDIQCSEVPA